MGNQDLAESCDFGELIFLVQGICLSIKSLVVTKKFVYLHQTTK